MFAEPVQRLVDELARLPGIGRKSAQRLAFHLLTVDEVDARRLAQAVIDMRDQVGTCQRCFNIAAGDECAICRDARQLHIAELHERIAEEGITEVIVATNPTMEGDATALYLARDLKPLGVRVTRLASGLPVGGDLDYADELTLGRALAGRREI